jgi:hypothetical protein
MPSASPQRPSDTTLSTSEMTGGGKAMNVNELATDNLFLPENL